MMDNQIAGGSYCTAGEYGGYGIPAHLMANYAMSEALLASDLALNGDGPECGEASNLDCEVDMQRFRQSVQLACNFTMKERTYDPNFDPMPVPFNNGWCWSSIHANKGGWHYRGHHDPDDGNHHGWALA